MQIGSAAEHHVAAPPDQFLARDVEGGERGGARRVDGVVRAAEVEAVGDPPGDHVDQRTGEGVLGQRWQLLVEFGGNRAEVTRQHGPQCCRAGQVTACFGTEHDAGAGPVEAALGIARVGQGPRRHLQGEQLHRFDRRQRGRRNAEAQRVERYFRQEAAPFRRRPRTTATAALRVVRRRIPAVRGYLGDRVDVADDVRPEGVQVRRAREHPGHAHDRHVERLRRGLVHRSDDVQFGTEHVVAGSAEGLSAAGDALVQRGDGGDR